MKGLSANRSSVVWTGGILVVTLMAALVALPRSGPTPDQSVAWLEVTYPRDETVFPLDIVAPTFCWQDGSDAEAYEVQVSLGGGGETVVAFTDRMSWQPTPRQWAAMKEGSLSQVARAVVTGVVADEAGRKVVSRGAVSFLTSPDTVEAPIFYREVPLPLMTAQRNRRAIRWRLGEVSSVEEPHTVLANLNTCANCHSFSADGKTLGMDVDYGADRGSYAVVEISPHLEIDREQLITWRDYKPEDGHRTLGLLSRVSPDGRYAVSTVNEVTVMQFLPDPYCSQLFFPIRGVLAVYDRAEGSFSSLAGADDPEYVQTNPVWSPDGKWIVFARAPAFRYREEGDGRGSRAPKQVADLFVGGGHLLRYDLYRIPFNNGRGGEARPLRGASGNGMSNYFAAYSPDGRWIVYCQAESFMFNRPDSALYIVPSRGGHARRLGCNAPDRMNSWHSWSPNSKWLVFSSKANGPYTQLWLTHIDEQGMDTPAVLLERFVSPDLAANLPEFVNIAADQMRTIEITKAVRSGPE